MTMRFQGYAQQKVDDLYADDYTGGPLTVEIREPGETDPMRGHYIDPNIGICRNCARSIEDIIEGNLDCPPQAIQVDYLAVTRGMIAGGGG